MQDIPARLEEEGICPANRVFGATHFHSLVGVKHSLKKFSLSITVAHLPGVHFKQFHMEGNEFPKLDFSPSPIKDKEDAVATSTGTQDNESELVDEEEEYTDDVITSMEKKRHLMMLINSFDIDMGILLPRLDLFFPKVPKFEIGRAHV